MRPAAGFSESDSCRAGNLRHDGLPQVATKPMAFMADAAACVGMRCVQSVCFGCQTEGTAALREPT
jgi:hypothetical protein